MKTFVAVFLGSNSGPAAQAWNALDESARQKRTQEGMQAWGQWVQRHQDRIVDIGAPLGKTKLIDKTGIRDTKNLLSAYTVVKAETHDEAARMFTDHPHFLIFPGDSVEVVECLPLPQG